MSESESSAAPPDGGGGDEREASPDAGESPLDDAGGAERSRAAAESANQATASASGGSGDAEAPGAGSPGESDATGGAGPPGGAAPENRSLMIVLSYLWILALVPLLMEEKDPEIQWHAKHGLVLTAAEIVFWLVIFMINALSGFLGCLLMPLYVLAWLGILGLHIGAMVKGVRGERLIIPGVSQYAERF